MGTCAAGASCANCGRCVAAVADFVRSQLKATDAAAVSAAFTAALPDIKAKLGSDLIVLPEVTAAIPGAIQASYQGNLAKRAGALCTQMQCKWTAVPSSNGLSTFMCVVHMAGLCFVHDMTCW